MLVAIGLYHYSMVKQLSTPLVQHMMWWDQKFITGETLSKPTRTTQSSKEDRTAKQWWPWPLNKRVTLPCDGDLHVVTDGLGFKVTVNPHLTPMGHGKRRRWSWVVHKRLIDQCRGCQLTVITRTITVENSLPRPNTGCDEGLWTGWIGLLCGSIKC